MINVNVERLEKIRASLISCLQENNAMIEQVTGEKPMPIILVERSDRRLYKYLAENSIDPVEALRILKANTG